MRCRATACVSDLVLGHCCCCCCTPRTSIETVEERWQKEIAAAAASAEQYYTFENLVLRGSRVLCQCVYWLSCSRLFRTHHIQPLSARNPVLQCTRTWKASHQIVAIARDTQSSVVFAWQNLRIQRHSLKMRLVGKVQKVSRPSLNLMTKCDYFVQLYISLPSLGNIVLKILQGKFEDRAGKLVWNAVNTADQFWSKFWSASMLN